MNIPEIKYVRNASFAAGVLFQSKWRVQILCAMRSGPVRLGHLGRLIPGASKKVLTQNLRQLEAEGIIFRRDLSDVVLHVEYELHETTKEGIRRLLDELAKWGGLHLEKM
jgi:DNA-binding HxlR family transcriptional regulator